MSKSVLITGGSGMVGSYLTKLLLEKGYTVAWLSRSGKTIDAVKGYIWDVEKQVIDEHAIDSIETIVHLAGEGIANKRWTKKQQRKIIDSRVKSAELLYKALLLRKETPKTFISASGTGYYGYDNGNKWLEENSSLGDDFVADVVKRWENAAEQFSELDCRVVKFRTGIVLSKLGGALEKITVPIRYGVGSALGSGNQYISWVHIYDLCNAILYAIENDKLNGTYNLVSDNPITNAELTRSIAKTISRPLIFPKVPAFILQVVLGEMSNMVLGSNRVLNKKIKTTGFRFRYQDVDLALSELLK